MSRDREAKSDVRKDEPSKVFPNLGNMARGIVCEILVELMCAESTFIIVKVAGLSTNLILAMKRVGFGNTM